MIEAGNIGIYGHGRSREYLDRWRGQEQEVLGLMDRLGRRREQGLIGELMMGAGSDFERLKKMEKVVMG